MKYFLIFFSFISISIFGQKSRSDNAEAIMDQHYLKAICVELFTAKTDVERKKYNDQLLKVFEDILNKPNSFEMTFDSLKNYMGILTSPDNQFKIINWNLAKDDKTYEYFGFIQSKFDQKKKAGFFKNEKTQV